MCTITVYTTGPTCMQCTMTKKAMTAAGLEFTEVDLCREPAAMEYVQEELQYSQAPWS